VYRVHGTDAFCRRKYKLHANMLLKLLARKENAADVRKGKCII
jgi:hypothetical protein